MKKRLKKLTLGRETLKTLAQPALSEAAGGSRGCEDTNTCSIYCRRESYCACSADACSEFVTQTC